METARLSKLREEGQAPALLVARSLLHDHSDHGSRLRVLELNLDLDTFHSNR